MRKYALVLTMTNVLVYGDWMKVHSNESVRGLTRVMECRETDDESTILEMAEKIKAWHDSQALSLHVIDLMQEPVACAPNLSSSLVHSS